MLFQEHKALNKLQSKNDVVITTANKDIAVIILDVNQCTKEVEQSTSYNKNKYFVKLWTLLENTTGRQSNPTGQVINLSNNYFTKENFQNF